MGRYRVTDDSVTVPGRGNPKYSGKSVTVRGEDVRKRKGPEPGRRDVGNREHPERVAGLSTARDTTSVRPGGADPILQGVMPNLR